MARGPIKRTIVFCHVQNIPCGSVSVLSPYITNVTVWTERFKGPLFIQTGEVIPKPDDCDMNCPLPKHCHEHLHLYCLTPIHSHYSPKTPNDSHICMCHYYEFSQPQEK